MTTILILAYLLGVIVAYELYRYDIIYKFGKQNFEISDIIFGAFISTLSWITVLTGIIVIASTHRKGGRH